MKVSVEQTRYYQNLYKWSADPMPNGIDDLVEKINMQLGAVEEVTDLGQKYQGILVAKIVSCIKHPDADKLNVCKIDDGGVNKEVERDSDGYVQVVCGAPNAREGLVTAWIPPKVVVPSTFGNDPLVLEAREIRGQVSNGMLASASELAISGDHAGIVEVEEEAKPGASFADTYRLNDYIIDIENKMFTHRPDLFGMMGVARELAGIQGQKYTSPDWYLKPLAVEKTDDLPLKVENKTDKAPRFMAVAISGVSVAPSPLWLQIDLMRVGIKPINNIVDLTNYFMMLTAQPLHAYDYDKVKSLSGGTPSLVVRMAERGEELKLLGGKTIKALDSDIAIATDKKIIGLGGVMGGSETEVDANTKNIILECANFDMYTIRRTSMAHGLFTDASTRFTKGQSPLQCPVVIAKTVDDIKNIAGGQVASDLFDLSNINNSKDNRSKVRVPIRDVNDILGAKIEDHVIVDMLKNVEFELDATDNVLNITAPFWRTDIEIPEDVVEELGRLYGFNKLPKTLPSRTTSPPEINENIEFKKNIRNILVSLGANEVLTYNFVHGDLLKKAGQNPEYSYKLRNALSPDLQCYRQSLTPSLLDKIHPNIKSGHDRFAIFEIGKTHIKGREEDGLPIEFERLALVFSADDKIAKTDNSAPYYQAKKYLDALFAQLGVQNVRFEPIVHDDKESNKAYFQDGRSATVYSGEHLLGRIGEYSPSVVRSFKLPEFSAGFELGLKPLSKVVNTISDYVPLNRYPSTEQDVTIPIAPNINYADCLSKVEELLRKSDYEYSIEPVSIYKSEGQNSKNVTFRLTLSHRDRTLTTEEVNKLISTLVDSNDISA